MAACAFHNKRIYFITLRACACTFACVIFELFIYLEAFVHNPFIKREREREKKKLDWVAVIVILY